MKRILTLFVMALTSWGFLSAQNGPEIKVGPKINFQAVVRHHDAVNDMDTLFHDQTVTCTIWVAKMDVGAYYAEVHRNVPTTENGLLSLKIGEGEPLPDYADRSLLDVDWSDWAIIFADIDLGIDGEEPVSFNVMINAMPYAIQASIGPLTTEIIAEYSKNVIDDEGMTQILDAIRNNPNGLKDGLKKTRDSWFDTVFGEDRISDEFFDELEESMILADMGVETSTSLVESLRNEIKEKTAYLEEHQGGICPTCGQEMDHEHCLKHIEDLSSQLEKQYRKHQDHRIPEFDQVSRALK